jgi:hypothetical protein
MEQGVHQQVVSTRKQNIKAKIKGWVKRFLPAEVAGTIVAVLVSTFTHYYTKNAVIAAYAGSVCETIAFYATIIIHDARIATKNLKEEGKTLSFRSFVYLLRNILLDFGVAELMDSLLLRPFCMYIFPIWLKNYPLGILAGKIASDIVFYLPVIISYELRIWISERKK